MEISHKVKIEDIHQKWNFLQEKEQQQREGEKMIKMLKRIKIQISGKKK